MPWNKADGHHQPHTDKERSLKNRYAFACYQFESGSQLVCERGARSDEMPLLRRRTEVRVHLNGAPHKPDPLNAAGLATTLRVSPTDRTQPFLCCECDNPVSNGLVIGLGAGFCRIGNGWPILFTSTLR